MAKQKQPKIKHDGPVSVLYDRGSDYPETVIGGLTFVSKEPVTRPNIYRVVTEKESAWYIRPDGTTIPDAEVKAIEAEFAALEGAKVGA